jgi:transposase
VLQRIGQLFDVERAAMRRPPEQRRPLRQRLARFIMDDLTAFLDASLATISGRSELAKAIRYARSRWTALTRYLDDGTLEISNNAAERAIRPLTSAGRISCSPAPMPAASAPPRSTPSLKAPSSTASYLREVLGREAKIAAAVRTRLPKPSNAPFYIAVNSSTLVTAGPMKLHTPARHRAM